MDKIAKSPTKEMFNGLHLARPLKPLSIYSRMIFSEQEASLQQRKSSNPFINFKFEVVNKCSCKRKLQDSSSGDDYETPAKKAFSPTDLSPDQGCFVDYCSPPASDDSVSPCAISTPASLDKTQTIKSEIRASAGSQLHSEHVECGSSTEPGVDEESVAHSLRCGKVLLNLSSAFDCDVEDILCLDPCGKVEGCQGPSSNAFQNDPSLIVSGPALESHNSHVEPLEGDAEEAWNIGSPIFESSIFQATLGGEEDTIDTSYETTLPLQVKVKSVVVVPSQLASSSKSAAPPLQEQNTKPNKPSPDENRCSTRPEVFDREGDWKREEELYVHSVRRQMEEHQGSSQDVMTELLTLMDHVADQRPGADGRQWQHPTDLTRRNYQRRFGNVIPRMTLGEWQSQSCPEHERFAKVPTFFQRSNFS
ncbi:S100P-binding protein isoform X2 [Anarrhichthys ocellatus]|uniref:S100P-binding protein isoform X2 n=1 Tax=Anarrhichthys ocellatus TaxID=433405 RepID=UPI0012ECF0A0|nr:S100P-binding protein isoform X2 [Anarrhichthys ocellatus]